ncbi:MAG TPA: CDP-alcohol phosphatidyltransferase family protein [Patescibacteria group bacterium]|nr:CDP-alcohol phosphatidyltransferase family protein [Patescibacteria group bacterium]
MADKTSHKRVNDILFGPLERPALQWLAAHMPAWMNPDLLTLIGIIGAFIIFAGYVLSGSNPGFLWLASLGFVINWFGDSLDGTLARYRKIERPKYGFFVDHTVDAFGQLWILAGIGLSPYVSFSVAMLTLVGYLMMSVLVYVTTFVTGEFKISYGKLGPTEIRVIAILANVAFFFGGIRTIEFSFGTYPVYDILILAIGLLLIGIFTVTTASRAYKLSKIDERRTTEEK